VVEVSRIIRTAPGRIFAVLADGWSYASWVVGAAHISPDSTQVRMADGFSSGVGRLLPDPVQALFLKPRNAEALRRLDDLAVHRG
jgi:hypothetical protein